MLNRRQFLRTAGLTAAGVAAAACTPSAAPVAPTQAVQAPTASLPPAASPSPAAAAVVTSIEGVQPLPQRARARMLFNPQGPQLLPIWVAQERGFFNRVGIDLEVTQDRGSSTTQLAMLARGDIDLVHTSPAPAMYNQLAQGFDIKIITSASVPREGRLNDLWLVVLPERAAEIRELRDLRGRTIEAGLEGTPSDLLAREALRAGGLTPRDASIQYRVRAPQDFLQLAGQKAADVFVLFEPFVTQAEAQGLLRRWKTYGFGDLAPWYKPSVIAASSQFNERSAPVLQKFLEVYLVASRIVNASEGRWTDELTTLVARNTNLPPQIITAQGGVPYFEPNGDVALDSLERIQQAWIDMGSIQRPIDTRQLLDLRPVQAAVARVGTVR